MVKKQVQKDSKSLPTKKIVAIALILIIGTSAALLIITSNQTPQETASSTQRAQETLLIEWQQQIPESSGRTVIETYQGDYLIISENLTISYEPYRESQLRIDRYTTLFSTVSSTGNLIKTQDYYSQLTANSLNRIIKTSDENYALATSIGTQFNLFKIDQQGNTQWTNTYTQTFWDSLLSHQFRDIIQTDDNGYAIIGYCTSVLPTPVWVVLVKIDETGNLEWQKAISVSKDTSEGSYPLAIYQTSDQGYVIVSSQHNQGHPEKYEITKVNSKGVLLWCKEYGVTDNYCNSSVSSSLKVDDGYIIAGTTSTIDGSAGLIIKTDLLGNLIWDKTYTYKGLPCGIESITYADDGDLMFIGTATQDNSAVDGESVTYTWIAQVDGTGNVVGELGINMGNQSPSPLTIIQITDNAHIFVGTKDQNTWIAKITNLN
jgi:hypothetical protein